MLLRSLCAAGASTDEATPACQVWDWIFAFDGGRGLLTDGIMSAGAQSAWCCSATAGAADGNGTCANSGVAGMSYSEFRLTPAPTHTSL